MIGSSTYCSTKNTAKQDLELNSFGRASIDISVANKDDRSTLAKQDHHSDHPESVSEHIEQALECSHLDTFGIFLTPATESKTGPIEIKQSARDQLVLESCSDLAASIGKMEDETR